MAPNRGAREPRKGSLQAALPAFSYSVRLHQFVVKLQVDESCRSEASHARQQTPELLRLQKCGVQHLWGRGAVRLPNVRNHAYACSSIGATHAAQSLQCNRPQEIELINNRCKSQLC
jgi:hypothetical protein